MLPEARSMHGYSPVGGADEVASSIDREPTELRARHQQ